MSSAVTATTPLFRPHTLRLLGPTRLPTATNRRSNSMALCCQVTLATTPPPLSSAEVEGTTKVGKKVRVNVPLKVYHVSKAPNLDLNGLEGVVKQYVGVWKGKSISANLPFKVEFFIPVEGQDKPVKFFAHLSDNEFEYLD